MFTLKITTTAPDPVSSRPIVWFADVTSVSLITRGGREFMDGNTSPGSEQVCAGPYYPAEDYAGDAQPHSVLSLLYVTRRRGQDDHVTYMVVEWAWLLGADGQTIERIAP